MADFFTQLERYFEEAERQRVIIQRLEARNEALQEENVELRARIAELETTQQKRDQLGLEHLVTQNKQLLALLAGRGDAEISKIYTATKELFELKFTEKAPQISAKPQLSFEAPAVNETPRLIAQPRVAPAAPKQPSPMPTSAIQEPIVPAKQASQDSNQPGQYKFAFGQTINAKPVAANQSSVNMTDIQSTVSPHVNAESSTRRLSGVSTGLRIGAETARFDFAASALPQGGAEMAASSLRFNSTMQPNSSHQFATASGVLSTVPYADRQTVSLAPSISATMQDFSESIQFGYGAHSQVDVPSKLQSTKNVDNMSQSTASEERASADMGSRSSSHSEQQWQRAAYSSEEQGEEEAQEEVAETKGYDGWGTQTYGWPATQQEAVVDISSSEPGI